MSKHNVTLLQHRSKSFASVMTLSAEFGNPERSGRKICPEFITFLLLHKLTKLRGRSGPISLNLSYKPQVTKV